MPALQVRDLPQDIYDRLCESARREHRSIAQQTTAILERHFKLLDGGAAEPARTPHPRGDAFEPPEVIAERIDRKKRIFARLDELGPIVVPDGFPSVVELIQEGRDERDGRFGL